LAQYVLDRNTGPSPDAVLRLLLAVQSPEFNSDAAYQRLVVDEITALAGLGDGQHNQAGG
jgi:hypothetical protein